MSIVVPAALASGLLFVAGFPPFDLGWLALVALAPALLAADRSGRPFLVGWLAGWLGFTGVVWWVYYAMAHFGGIPWPAAAALALVLTAAMACFWGLALWARHRVRAAFPRLPDVVVFPVVWTAAEYLRATLPDLEFPWALLGHTQYLHGSILQVADVGGAWALGFLVALANAGVASFVAAPRARGWARGLRPLAAALVLLLAAAGYGRWRLAEPEPDAGSALRVAVVQGDVPQGVKWDPQFREETFVNHVGLTREAGAAGADFVVWSESATAFVYQREPAYQERIADLARETGAPLLFGTVGIESAGGRRSYRNRAYLVDASGAEAGWYDKQQLVPFGEFVPFQRLLFFAKPLVQAVGNFTPGPGSTLLDVPGARVGTLVCYEVVFPDLVRRFAAAGATLLVNITNDAWYERSAASAQQFANLVLRAVENRRPIARAANTGISGFVDAKGRILGASELFVRGQYAAPLTPDSRTTFYTRHGDWLPRLCTAAFLALLAATCLPSRRRR